MNAIQSLLPRIHKAPIKAPPLAAHIQHATQSDGSPSAVHLMHTTVTHWPCHFPSIHINDQFVLREHHAIDLENFFDYYTQPEINRHILVTRPKQLAETAYDIDYNRGLYYVKTGLFWSLIDKTNGQLAGTVGLYTNRNPVEICYDLRPQYWNQGIMTKIVTELSQFIQKQWPHLDSIQAIILKENTASEALLTKLGFCWLKTITKGRQHQGHWYDLEIYQRNLPRH